MIVDDVLETFVVLPVVVPDNDMFIAAPNQPRTKAPPETGRENEEGKKCKLVWNYEKLLGVISFFLWSISTQWWHTIIAVHIVRVCIFKRINFWIIGNIHDKYMFWWKFVHSLKPTNLKNQILRTKNRHQTLSTHTQREREFHTIPFVFSLTRLFFLFDVNQVWDLQHCTHECLFQR